jgi:hypothetical protein
MSENKRPPFFGKWPSALRPEEQRWLDAQERLANDPMIKQINEELCKFKESPIFSATQKFAQDFQWLRELQERALRPSKAEPEPPKPEQKPKRRKGGGRRRKLTPEEIITLRQIYRNDLENDPKLKQASAVAKLLDEFAKLRKHLPERERAVSPGTLVRHIVRPVWDESK